MRYATLLLTGLGAAALAALALLAGLAPPALPVPPQSEAILSGVTLINPGVERLLDQSIVIGKGRILAVRPRAASDPAPACAGCFAIPGLIDAHVHTPPRIAIGNQELFALLHLAHGVTTIRDVGESDASVAALASRLNAGEEVGPHMLRCGPVLDGNPPGWPSATLVETPQAAREIVDRLADAGVDCIKVYNELGSESFAAVARAAARRGLPLIGHVPHAVGLAGVADFEAQHMTGVPYVSLPRPPTGWDIRSEDVLHLSAADADRAFDLARARRISFTPTLANFTLRLTASDPQRFPPSEGSQRLPAYWSRVWDQIAGHPSTPAEIDQQLRAVPALRALVARAHQHGIDVLAGTDTLMPWVVPGESLLLEIDELRQALGSTEAALASATTVNGRHLAAGELGVIAPGARADVLLLPEDPTLDLAALRAWRIVYVNGRRYDRATLDAWLAAYARHFHGALYEAVMGTLAGWAAGGYENRVADGSR